MEVDLEAYRKLVDRLAQNELTPDQAATLMKLADDLQDLRDENLRLKQECSMLEEDPEQA